MEAKELVDALADRLAEMETKTLYETLGDYGGRETGRCAS